MKKKKTDTFCPRVILELKDLWRCRKKIWRCRKKLPNMSWGPGGKAQA